MRRLLEGLSPEQIRMRAYPSEWTVADTASHIGSAAVLMGSRLEADLAELARRNEEYLEELHNLEARRRFHDETVFELERGLLLGKFQEPLEHHIL